MTTTPLRRRVYLQLAAIGALGTASLAALAEDGATAMRLRQLSSSDSDVRLEVSRELFGSGIADRTTWDAIRALIEAELPVVTGRDPRVDEIGQHLLALGASGDLRYMPVIEASTRSTVRGIASGARDAKTLLLQTSREGRPLIEPDKVRLITEHQAEDCAYIAQKACEDRGGTIESCSDELREEVVQSGGDSMLVMSQSSAGGWFGVASVTANVYRCTLPTGPQPR